MKVQRFVAMAAMAAEAEKAMNWSVAARLWWQAAGMAEKKENGDWAEHRAQHCRVREKAKWSITGRIADLPVGETTT